jgi:5-methylcytosine-specific restriction protein A
MPTRAKQVCRKAGCGRLCDGSYCDRHQRRSGRSDEGRERQRENDRRRGSSSSRGYGANWQKLRHMVLCRDPLCQLKILCDGMEVSTEVDHIVPKKSGGDDSLENLQGACGRCHRHKTAVQDSDFAARRFKQRKIGKSVWC